MSELYKQPTKSYKTERQKMNWFLLDAEGKTLGHLSSEIAKILRGKHKPTFTPNTDQGDGIIVVNAEKIVVTGNKAAQKEYITHSRYKGGLKRIPYERVLERHPERILQHAVKGMMPKNKLGRAMLKKLRIFSGAEHNMEAQKPQKVAI